jgi:4-aminobutyrate aminotransferase
MSKRNVASFIIEPLIAEGGAMPLIPGFLDEAGRICHQNHKLLVVDAVQMWGKMGNWLSPEVQRSADAVCVGKYSLICAALLKDPRGLGFDQDFAGKPGKFGATWQGHLSAEIATLLRMDTIEGNGMFANGVAQAEAFYDGLRQMAAEEKGVIRPRIFGSYVGFDVSSTDEPSAESRKNLVGNLQEEGILILGAGETSIRFAPRLDTQKWEVDALLNHISDNLPNSVM